MRRKLVSSLSTYTTSVDVELAFCWVFLAYYVAFGAHGPRSDYHPPGSVTKIIFATLGSCTLGGVLFGMARYFGMCFHAFCSPNVKSDAFLQVGRHQRVSARNGRKPLTNGRWR